MQFKNKVFNIVAETERLIIRPLENSDYKNWLSECENRLPSQHRYDEGKPDMSERSDIWFGNFVKNHQELAADDMAYIFGVFRKEDGKHLGMIDLSTYEREEFQWGRIGYNIHNHFWNNGYGKEAVKEALNIAFDQLEFHRIEAHINLV